MWFPRFFQEKWFFYLKKRMHHWKHWSLSINQWIIIFIHSRHFLTAFFLTSNPFSQKSPVNPLGNWETSCISSSVSNRRLPRCSLILETDGSRWVLRRGFKGNAHWLPSQIAYWIPSFVARHGDTHCRSAVLGLWWVNPYNDFGLPVWVCLRSRNNLSSLLWSL